MSQINQYQGMLSDILIERGASIIAESTHLISAGSSIVRIRITAYNGPLMPKGSTIQVKPNYTNNVAGYTVDSDLDIGDTEIKVINKSNTFDIPAKTNIFFNALNSIQYQYKRFFVEHIHMFETGQTHGKDQLINSQKPGGGKHNNNYRAALTRGSSYPNNWSTKLRVLKKTKYKCKHVKKKKK